MAGQKNPATVPGQGDPPHGAPNRGRVPPDHVGQCAVAVSRALDVASPDEAVELEALAQRCRSVRLRILVVGDAKRGKSTVANALLGRPVLPTSVTPQTAIATTVRGTDPDEPEHASVDFGDRQQDTAVGDISQYVTEQENPENVKGVRGVVVALAESRIAELPVELVDSPGLHSVFEHNTERAEEALATVDAVVLVTGIDPPITQTELDIACRVHGASRRTYVLVNKMDRHSAEEVAKSVGFTRDTLARATGSRPVVHVISSRYPDNREFATFRDDLVTYLREHARTDARLSILAHATALLTLMLDRRRTEEAALRLALDGHREALGDLHEHLEALRDQRAELSERLRASGRRARRDLDRGAAQESATVSAEATAAVERSFRDADPSTSLNELEEKSRTAARDSIRTAVDRWRDASEERLQTELEQIATRTLADTRAHVREVSDALSAVLHVETHVDVSASFLPPRHQFRYDFSPAPTWDPPLPGLTRRLMPSAARRRRLLQDLGRSAAQLADRQVGRARVELQARLDAGITALERELDRTLAATVDQMQSAVIRAIRDASDQERRAHLDRLQHEQGVLTVALTHLTQPDCA